MFSQLVHSPNLVPAVFLEFGCLGLCCSCWEGFGAFPSLVAVVSAGGRTHKLIFPRQIELAATAKTILGVSRANLARGQAKPFLVHLPSCYWVELPGLSPSPSLSLLQVQSGTATGTAAPGRGCSHRKGLLSSLGVPYTPQAQHTFTCTTTTQSSLHGRSKPEISPSCESSAGLLSKICLQASYQKIQ